MLESDPCRSLSDLSQELQFSRRAIQNTVNTRQHDQEVGRPLSASRSLRQARHIIDTFWVICPCAEFFTAYSQKFLISTIDRE